MEPITLDGVPETLLWNLYQRANEARLPDGVLHDPRAVELADSLDYPFAERFGAPRRFLSQGHALRVRTFDQAVRDFLAGHPDGLVVALAEGLETQFWRVDNGRVRWLTVELPETVAVRERLLPGGERRGTVACSALDPRWTEAADAGRGVLITAQGLLMYLRPPEVRELLAMCAERFPGGRLVFDAVPRWFSERTVRGKMRMSTGYQAPPMPWGLNAGRLAEVAGAHPNIVDVREIPAPRGTGAYYGTLAPLQARIPGLRNLRTTMTVAVRFG
jgi:O-methyltransferase involved in polyketide biosynthesis